VRVRVLFFGRLKEIVGREAEQADVETGARVEDLFARYSGRFPQLAELRASIAPSVNLELADWQAPLSADDEVGFLPPVSGGSGAPTTTASEEICELIRAPLLRDEWLASLATPSDGAMVVFEGYEPMAKTKMHKLAAALRRDFGVSRVVLVHRLGRIEIGETSILIGVSSPHRQASFDACRRAIDDFKRTVPVWKKEFFEDGSAWAEGEPLPHGPTAVR
jgi:molybdopterin synthase catalytic subunit/molybdopterin converting factor small subunit